MTSEVTITERGTITIPAELRRLFGFRANDRLIVEQTDEGVLLRPAIVTPVEIYSEERISEFVSDEDEIAEILPELERE